MIGSCFVNAVLSVLSNLAGEQGPVALLKLSS